MRWDYFARAFSLGIRTINVLSTRRNKKTAVCFLNKPTPSLGLEDLCSSRAGPFPTEIFFFVFCCQR